jgi:hypothetical protein
VSTPFSAGPVASFKGLWQAAQLDWKSALPSCANRFTWLRNSENISMMEVLASFRYIAFFDSDTGIKLFGKLFSLDERGRNYNTKIKSYSESRKKFSAFDKGFSPYFIIDNFSCHVFVIIFLDGQC